MPEPSVNLEREVKLDVGLHFELPQLTGVVPGVVANAVPPARLQAIYLDTADLRLMRWGLTLRHRRDTLGGAGAESGWTLKLPSDADGVALVRTELSWPGSFGPVPTEAVNMVRAQARTARLVPVAKLLTDRRRVELRDEAGRKLAEIDDDVVSVMDGRRLAARFRQLELEVTDVAPPNLLELALAALTAAGGLPGDDRPKVVRAIGPRAALGPDVVIPGLDRNATVADVVGAAVATALTRLIRHDPGVRLGDDPEHVHQARVGTRRLRSDLRTFWRLLDPDWAGPVRAELGWLAAALGEVRDADVLMGRFQTQIRGLASTDAKPAAALLRRLAVEREDARDRLLDAMNSDRYLLLLDNLAAAAARPPLARTGPPEGSGRPEATTTMANGPVTNGPVTNGQVARPAASGLVDGVGPLGKLRLSQSGLTGGLGPVQDGRRSQSEIVGGSGSLGDRRTCQSEIVAAVVSKAAAAEDAGATGGAPADLPGTPAAAKAAGASAGEATAGPAALANATVAVAMAVAAATPALPPLAAAGTGAPAGGDGSGPGATPATKVLPALVRRPWRHLKQAVAHLGDDPTVESLHEVRIRAKRLRYAAEAASGVMGKPARQLAVAVAAVQSVLGDMQDAVVAEAWLRRHASGASPGQAMVAGQLVTLQRQEQAACRARWAKPWKAASKKKLRRWLSG